ncbi:transglycosylase domain-containing protein [Micromonospora sp. NPDC000089]|uniref:transglycosylase domain-containing protein n=1 Tax=unclassified Micromonospora TaxID=2617518 RepID=UPI0036BE700B
MLIAAFAVFIMLAGVGVIGFTYYSTNVVLPNQIKLPLATTVYANDGKTVIARVGEQNRTFVSINQIPQFMRDAVAAAEDKNFYEHSGVDYKGIARAAWNNVTGGDKQGASTITQQYARNAYENLQDDSYARKVKEAIVASKLNDEFSKDQIMEHYLNTIYFGRNAYGIEAAAQAYFGTTVSKITVDEAAVLAALIKQPEPSASHKGYDPAINPVAAKERWDYVVQNMIQMHWVDAPGKPAHPTVYPTKKLKSPKLANAGVKFGVDSPYGNVINYVAQEMREKSLCTDDEAAVTKLKPLCSEALKAGGYRITTTIDDKVQQSAVALAQRKAKGSLMEGQPKNLMAAVVAVDPKTGGVLAYYGGDNGTGTDYAGKNYENGVVSGLHPPGSSFKVYTLAAALKAGKSIDSRWKGKGFNPEGYPKSVWISNAGDDNPDCGDSCTLETSTLKSLNVPFFHVTQDIGADKVLEMAKQAGITAMQESRTPKVHDLTKMKDPKELTRDPFDYFIGFGQYGITVLDHANGLATFANGGVYNKAHFVKKFEKQDPATGTWQKLGGEQLKPEQRIPSDVVADVTSVLEKYPARIKHKLEGGREAAAKTGTWEQKPGTEENGDAWTVGYTPQIATAVWIGNLNGREPIRDKSGNKISGSTLPGAIWERFMDAALDGKDKLKFPPAAHVGDPNSGNAPAPPPPPPAPEQPQQPQDCGPLGLFCPEGGTPMNPGGGNPAGGNQGPGNPTDPRPRGGGNGGGLLPSLLPKQQ